MSVLEPGAIFGRDFRVVKALRAGGMGAVYVVDQLSTGKQRALKVMAAELTTDPATRERFVLEAHAAAKIDSEHVVEIVTAGVDEESGAPFIVMELLKGEELADALERTGPLPLGDVAEILQQVGHALEQAHAQGIVHRDLKPENIFLAASRRRDAAFTAKILDFGIAKLVADSQKTGTQPLGTPLFMAPEQTDRRGRICPGTDVWALGLISFRLLTGRDFWKEADGSLPMLLREIVVDPIPWATHRAAEVGIPAGMLPPGYDAWFARAVNRDIDARFAHAGEAVHAFAELVAVDAPRGKLSMTGVMGPGGGTGQVSATGMGQAMGMGASMKVTPPGVSHGYTGAPVNAATNQGATPAAPQKKGSSVVMWIVLPMVALGIGGFAAIKIFSGKADTPGAGPAASSSAVASAPVVPASAPASAAPALAPGTCPEGMAMIKGGKMFMGARDLTPDTKPPHEVNVSSFCLDKTEVTTKAYMACTAKGDCERPLEKVSWNGLKPDREKRYSPLCNAGFPERADHPINCVAWPMADNFCKKKKARLPTEAEWEYAARGSSQRKYPWGDDPPSATLLNACGVECAKWGDASGEKHQTMYLGDDGFAATAPVGKYPAGASSDGVLDLAGNVWEWTADWYGPYAADPSTDPKGPATGTQRVVRGGDFFGFQPDWARPAFRWKTEPDSYYSHAVGFRCAFDAK